MRTVGQILKETRENKEISLEEVEKNTKIRIELLLALEKDDYKSLPPPTFVQGFIKNYGKFLHLNTEKLLAVFRRDFEAKKHPPHVLESFSNPIETNVFRLTPSRVIAFLVTVAVISFFTYLWFEYRQYIGAPDLQVVSPKDQQTVEIPSVLVKGKTEPEVKVLVNNQEIDVDSEGNFQKEIKLSSPVNTLTISATGKFGQTAKVERVVVVKK